MAGLNLNKKLWRIPQQGMVRGVCAGLAHYLDVPVKLVRVVTVLSIFFGLAFITMVAYIILSFVLDPMPDSAMSDENAPTSSELLDAVDAQLSAGEQRLREVCHLGYLHAAKPFSSALTERTHMNQRWQQAGQQVKPGLKFAGKLVLLTALRYGPAGVAGWAIKSVARKPVRMLLAVALEPMLKKLANRVSRRYFS